MLIDYLRYVAFAGQLRGFFVDGLDNYADPFDTTGQHLRYSPQYLQKVFGPRRHAFVHNLYCRPGSEEFSLEQLMDLLGIARGADELTSPQYFSDRRPGTFGYKASRVNANSSPPELQIIVDIHPFRWTERYAEPRSYEGVPVLYRRAGPAAPSIGSGDKLFTQEAGPARFGTLCGFFRTSAGEQLALTCGHVAAAGSNIMIEQSRRVWRLPLWRQHRRLGVTLYQEICGPLQRRRGVEARVDAALIQLTPGTSRSKNSHSIRSTEVKPITALLQEAPVQFRGGGRSVNTPARVAAVTVKKSIDIFKNGQLREIGDVLMLGHRQAMYIAQPVSRPGDSGAAVRQDVYPYDPSTQVNEWHGMLIGGDDTGAFASHAEHLWSWAAHATGDGSIQFGLGD